MVSVPVQYEDDDHVVHKECHQWFKKTVALEHGQRKHRKLKADVTGAMGAMIEKKSRNGSKTRRQKKR